MKHINSRLKIDSGRYLVVEGGRELGFRRQRDFNLDLTDIRIVGISGSLSFDDEEFYLNLISESGDIYSINSYLITDEFLTYLEQMYLIDRSIFRRSREFYENRISEVIYPLKLKGKPLFEKLNISLLSVSKWIMRKTRLNDYNDFILSKDVLSYLTKKSAKSV